MSPNCRSYKVVRVKPQPRSVVLLPMEYKCPRYLNLSRQHFYQKTIILYLLCEVRRVIIAYSLYLAYVI